MKAEHRKELETNILAQQLNKAFEGLKQGPSRNTMVWVGLAVAIVLVGLLFRYFLTSSRTGDSERWMKLDEVIFPEQLDQVLAEKDLRETEQGRLARFKEARLKLGQGLRDLGSNRQIAQKRIEEALQTYEELARASGRVPLLHQEALWGAAKANEALGNYEASEEQYGRLVKKYPDSALGKDAKKQLERLENEANRKDLNELKKRFGETARGS